jgi:hypothetical protein
MAATMADGLMANAWLHDKKLKINLLVLGS